MTVLSTEGRRINVETIKRKGGAYDRAICQDGRRVLTFSAEATQDIIAGIKDVFPYPVELGLNKPIAQTSDGRDIALFVEGREIDEKAGLETTRIVFCVGDREKPRRMAKVDADHVRGLLALLGAEDVDATKLVADQTQGVEPTVHELLTMTLDPHANPWDYPEDLPHPYPPHEMAPAGLISDQDDSPIRALLDHGIGCPTCGSVDE